MQLRHCIAALLTLLCLHTAHAAVPDQAALDAIKHWRFVPGTRNGVPEISWVVVPMPFSLN